MIPVILSGGSGTRLWPVSRKSHPKQFWPLVSEASLLEETCRRLDGQGDTESPIVVCNEEHRFFVAHQLQRQGVEGAAIILEPAGRNTAPAVAVAALHALESHRGGNENDPVLAVFPADHTVQDNAAFLQALAAGKDLALRGHLVTFGIVPSYPETGYGYIQGGTPSADDPVALPVERFVEKPDLATAEAYVAAGDFFWNSGMFMFRASRFLDELKRHAPGIAAGAEQAYRAAGRDLDFVRLDPELFSACPSDSVDYAVMERTDAAVVVPLDAGWNDVGAWSALWEIGARDPDGNVKEGDVLTLDSHNCYLRSEGRLIATVGVDDHVVVETPDVVLVAHRDKVQDVKTLVERMREQQRSEVEVHSRVYRPWGCFQGIDRADRYQVKRITVNPGASISLQMHHHRAEHWIVVKGTARITRGDETFLLSEDQSTYIPIGEKHRLENPGQIPLEIIEVQSGTYLGEDDIVRFEDLYGRREG